MTPKEKAIELFNQHYMVLFDSESDKGEEVLVSILAIKSALVTAKEVHGQLLKYHLLSLDKTNERLYWQKVIDELEKI